MADTDIIILKALLESNSEFVSGNMLATELGISRVGVWARLEKLREEGFKVEAIRHRGYRLLQEPTKLNERLLKAYLDVYHAQAEVVFCKDIDSTNNEAEKELANGRKTPFAVFSSSQKMGRGRLGRRWYSPDEGNLYASFAFRPNLPPMKMQTITLWMGLKVCEFLNEELELPVKLKWPNDLFLNGKKVAGMLTEARIDADRTRDLVFGIGLNVNGDPNDWPEDLPEIATSLSYEMGENLLINQVATRIALSSFHAYQDFIDGRYTDRMNRLWEKYNFLDGKEVNAELNGKAIKGIANGITENGALILNTDSNEQIIINSGEVSLGSKLYTE